MENTRNLGETECIYCTYRWSGEAATNGSLETEWITCPECGQMMGVTQFVEDGSIEYECWEIM